MTQFDTQAECRECGDRSPCGIFDGEPWCEDCRAWKDAQEAMSCPEEVADLRRQMHAVE